MSSSLSTAKDDEDEQKQEHYREYECEQELEHFRTPEKFGPGSESEIIRIRKELVRSWRSVTECADGALKERLQSRQ